MCGGGGGIGKVVGSIGSAIGGAVKGVVGAVRNVAKNPIFQAVAPIALNAFFPGLGAAAAGALNLSAAWAPAIGGAITGGIMGGVGGKGLGGVLKGAAIGGISSGIADYAMTGNNPLSGMFSGQEGGIANNALSAGGTGSTQLTGLGSGLGTDKSTLGAQFGQLNPNPTSMPTNSLAGLDGSYGGINPGSGAVGSAGASSSAPGLTSKLPSISGLTNANQQKPASGGMLSGLVNKAKGLLPTSTLGKVALGGAGLTLLGGLGGGSSQAATGGPPPTTQDASFNRPLQKLDFNYNPQFANNNRPSLQNYGVDYSYYNPQTGRFEQRGQNQNQGEQQFFTPGFAPPTTAAAGGLMRYAEGGMSDVNTDHGYLRGPGDGVSDDIPATIAGKQPARLASGEYIIPSRIVSEIGNGSSEAGAKRLDQFIRRVNQLRTKTKDWAKDTKAYKELPA